MKNMIVSFMVIFLLGCAMNLSYPDETISNYPEETTNPPVSSSETDVEILNSAFNPSEVVINRGTTVKWVNSDNITHTLKSDTGLFDSGEMPSGAEFSYVFDSEGIYNYYCANCPNITGRIIVE